MSLKLYTYPENPRAYKALISARYVGVNVETPKFEFGTDNKTERFVELFPFGKVPALETPEGPIFESNAIARYIARLGNASLYGSSLYETGAVDQWVDLAANEIEPAMSTWLGSILGYIQYQKNAVDKAKEQLFKALGVLDGVLTRKTFLVGNKVTLADIVLFCTLLGLYKFVFDRQVRARFPHVSRWFGTILGQPNVAAVVGAFEYCEVAAEPAAPQKGGKAKKTEEEAGSTSGAAAAAAEGGKKGGKQPKGGNKKQEKAEEAAPAVTTTPAAQPEEEEETHEEPKPKNPLDLLPKSSFNLEEWKRVYSNAKNTRNDALPYLWEHFDNEGYSFWFASYKYQNELKQAPFRTGNLVGGFHQRCDECRKYAFSSMLILGTNEKQEVEGVWILRSKEIPEVMRGVPDFEVYDFKHADPSNPADKSLIEDLLCWDRPIRGLEVLDGKNFK